MGDDEYVLLLSQLAQLIDACIESSSSPEESHLSAIEEMLRLIHDQYLPAIDLYRLWLKYQLHLRSDDLKGFLSLFETLLSNFPHALLLLPCLEHMIELCDNDLMSSEQVREAFEKVVRACGVDVFTGSLVWEKYIAFEVEEYEDLLDSFASQANTSSSATSEEKQALLLASKKRFLLVIHRALALPLANSEGLLARCEQILAEHCLASEEDLIRPDQLAKKYQQGLASRKDRLALEVQLAQLSEKSQNENEKGAWVEERWAVFQAYLAYEEKQQDYPRLQRLHERCLMEFPEKTAVTVNYALFLLATLRQPVQAHLILHRALRRSKSPHRHHLPLHHLYLLTNEWLMERRGKIDEERTIEIPLESAAGLQSYLEEVMGQGLASAEDYLSFYLHLINHLRRVLHAQSPTANTIGETEEEEDMEVENKSASSSNRKELWQRIQDIILAGQNFLESYYPSWVEGWFRLTSLAAEMDYIYAISYVTTSTAAITNPHGHGSKEEAASARDAKSRRWKRWEGLARHCPDSLWPWRQALQHYVLHNEIDLARSTYRRMLTLISKVMKKLNTQEMQEVLREYLHWEDLHGDRETIVQAYQRLLPAQEALYALLLTQQQQVEQQQQVQSQDAIASAEHVHSGYSNTTVAVQSDNRGTSKHSNNNRDLRKKKNDDSDRSLQQESKQKKRSLPVAFESAPEGENDTGAAVRVGEEQQPKAKRAKNEAVVPHAPSSISQSPVALSKTLLVKNLPFTVPADELEAHLRETLRVVCLSEEERDWTETAVVEAVLSKAGGSRGMVRISWPSSSTPSSDALDTLAARLRNEKYQERPLVIEIESVSCAVKEHQEGKERDLVHTAVTTIFVHQLPQDIEVNELEKLFSSCGAIFAVQMNQGKACALVQFSTTKARDRALLLAKQHLVVFRGQEAKVAKSRFAIKPLPSQLLMEEEKSEIEMGGVSQGIEQKNNLSEPSNASEQAPGDKQAPIT
eukprot:scaffold11667_cov328-Ochromonas_danica.AAC.1